MSEVKRYLADEQYPGQYSARCDLVPASAYDTAQSQLAALREELAKAKQRVARLEIASASEFESVQLLDNENSVLKQSLADAERRNAELEKDAARWNFFSSVANELQAFPHSWGKMTHEKMNHMCDEAMTAALNPNPEAASHDE